MAGLGETTAAMARFRAAAAEYALNGAVNESTGSAGILRRVTGFGADPGALDMFVHVPPGVSAGAPLVIALHGCTQTAQAYASGAGWIELADRLGFVLLCPEQTAANNAQRCFNWFEPGDIARGAGEAASIRAMIEHALALHRLDRRRVFVTGLSAGGAMTSVMLATYPELFAGGAIVAGLPFGAAYGVQEALAAMFQGRAHTAADLGRRVRDASPHDGPWPRVSIWHGAADHTVQPANLEHSVRQWTNLHGLSEQATLADARGRDHRRTWTDAQGRALVESHLIAGLGHGVPLATGGPDGVGVAGPFLLEAGVSSSIEIARFWGLADAAAEPRAKPASKPAEPPPRPLRVSEVLEPAVRGVEATIQRALRAAGLIKAD